MPRKFKVIVSHEAEKMLLEHMRFLANVSIPASKRFLASFKDAKQSLAAFPLSGPYEDEASLPPETYRTYLFYGRYKILYEVVENEIYIDAIIDCRQDTGSFGFLQD